MLAPSHLASTERDIQCSTNGEIVPAASAVVATAVGGRQDVPEILLFVNREFSFLFFSFYVLAVYNRDGGGDISCYAECRTLAPRKGVLSCSVLMVRHPPGSCMVSPLLSLEVAAPENE